MKPDGRLLRVGALAVALAGCGGQNAPERSVEIHTVAPTTTTPPAVLVPSVAGESVARARAALQAAGLVGRVQKIFWSTPAGVVIRTSPPGFSSAAPGGVITVVVSAGPPKVMVPRLVADSEAYAVRVATRLGLVVVVVRQPGSGRPGHVNAQSLTAGSSVPRGSTVLLTVESAPPIVAVPSVVGEAEETAVTTLSGLGLTIALRVQAVIHVKRDHLVLSQSPSSGARLPKGSRVTLTVGVYRQRG